MMAASSAQARMTFIGGRMKDPSIWKWLASDPGRAALAGALGGLVRWITLRDSWKEGVPALILGGVAAVYLGPIVEPVLAQPVDGVAPKADTSALAAFITGLGGVGISGFVLDLVRLKAPGGRGDEK